MEKYELMIVIPGEAKDVKRKQAEKNISDFVKFAKGKITKTDKWVKRELSYPIEKNTSGVFLYFELELPRGVVNELSRKVELDDLIIRHLLVKAN